MTNNPLKQTPLHDNHVRCGARMVPFAGYSMPVQYQGVLDETRAVRSTMGLFDVSHMGQFSLRGKQAREAIQSLVTNNVDKLQLGQAQYSVLCNDQGGAIDDLVVYYRAEDHIYLCVNACNLQKDFDWIQNHLSDYPDVTLSNESDETALLALQGPKAEALLSTICDERIVRELNYYWGAEAKVLDLPCFLSRTGYTGEDGFELYVPARHASQLWDALLEQGKDRGLVPAGLGARDTLRLEMGYALYGHELNETTSPLCARLGWVVKLKQPKPFVGKEALKQQKENGIPKRLLALKIEDKRIAREGYAILNQAGDRVGEITSGTFSPHLNHPIALGFVEAAAAKDSQYSIEIRKQAIPATPTQLPFVPSHTK